jgi:hypothetical protein
LYGMRIDPLGKFPCQLGVSACVLITSAALTVVLLTQLGPICERDRVCVCRLRANKKQRLLQPKSVRQTQQTNFESWFSRRSGLMLASRSPRVVYLSHYHRFQLLFAESRSRFPLCMLDFHYLSLLRRCWRSSAFAGWL